MVSEVISECAVWTGRCQVRGGKQALPQATREGSCIGGRAFGGPGRRRRRAAEAGWVQQADVKQALHKRARWGWGAPSPVEGKGRSQMGWRRLATIQDFRAMMIQLEFLG